MANAIFIITNPTCRNLMYTARETLLCGIYPASSFFRHPEGGIISATRLRGATPWTRLGAKHISRCRSPSRPGVSQCFGLRSRAKCISVYPFLPCRRYYVHTVSTYPPPSSLSRRRRTVSAIRFSRRARARVTCIRIIRTVETLFSRFGVLLAVYTRQ